MSSFKPLLKLNGYPMVELTVQSALDGGAQNVCVVTGHKADLLEEALHKLQLTAIQNIADKESAVQGLSSPKQPKQGGVCFAHDSDYAQSTLLRGIQLGVASLQSSAPSEASLQSSAPSEDTSSLLASPSPPDLASVSHRALASPSPPDLTSVPHRVSHAVFIIPGDVPGVSPQTFASLNRLRTATGAPVIVPTYKGVTGHPVLVGSECFDVLLGYAGEGGLKQALSEFTWKELEVDDPGILLDAANLAAFETLQVYVGKTRGVNKEIVRDLYMTYNTPANVQSHTAAVAEVAQRMAYALNKQGYGLDSELCRSGGELHDLNRLEQHHSQVAANNLSARGYERLAVVVGAHDRELCIKPRLFTEENLVFVADKLIKETTLVQIKHRYEGALKKYPPSTEFGKLIQKDSASALTLLQHYVEETGDEALMRGTERHVRSSYADT